MDTLSKLIYIEINHPPRSSLVAVRVRLSGDDSLIYRSPVATINNRRPRLEPSLCLESTRPWNIFSVQRGAAGKEHLHTIRVSWIAVAT